MRRNQKRQLPNPLYGLITVLVIGLFVYFVFVGLPFGGGYEVNAILRGAPHVQPGSKVRIAGVNVGKVKTSELGPRPGLTRITLQLKDSALPLHRDATLKLRPRTFLEGGMFVDLRPGSPSAPLMHEGDTIPVGSTAVPVLLGHATADLRYDTRQNLRRLFHAARLSLEGGGAEGLHRAQKHIAPAFRGLAIFAEASRGEHTGDLAGAVKGSAKTLDAIATRDAQLADLVTGLNRSARALGSRREQLGQSFEELNAFLSEARPAEAELNRLFPTARAFARELRPSIRAAPTTLRLALPFLDQAQGILGPRELPALLEQADPAVRSLARLEPPLRQTLALTLPVMQCLRDNAIPTLKTKINDPPNSSGEPVYRDLIHSLPGQASVAQNFDGNGPAIRYHAGFGDRTVSTKLPGTEPIVGLTSQSLLGSRPRFTNQVPPFKPRERCADQEPPNLNAETGPAPMSKQISSTLLRLKLRRLDQLLHRRPHR